MYDTEDSRVVYTVFEVLNSRGLAVDWIDKTKSVLMGLAAEYAENDHARDASIDNLKGIWANIYREIAREDVAGDEILRIAATLYYSGATGKPLSADDSLTTIREACDHIDKPRIVSERLLEISRKLAKLYANDCYRPVTKVLHARMLAVAIMLAKDVKEEERSKLLHQWERVTFRVFELHDNDARTRVGDYVRTSTDIVRSVKPMSFSQIMKALKGIGEGFPIETGAHKGIWGVDWYTRSPEICRYILWNYEEHLAARAGKGATIDEFDRRAIWKVRAVDSIEHVFPQSGANVPAWKGKLRIEGRVQRADLHFGRIGNLILLPIMLNQESRNHPFQKKKEIYGKHNLRMVAEITSKNDWTLDEINGRERAIVEWAKTRWCDI